MAELKFSENEYMSIRTEMIERIKMINSQASTALITILSSWTAGFTFKMALISNANKFLLLHEKMSMELLGAIIFLIPIYFFIPLAVKSGENLTQIASLSAYIRVFYDYPLREGKDNRNWETSNNLLSNANVDRKNNDNWIKMFNEEYTILALISLGIYFIFGILNVWELVLQYGNKSIGYKFVIFLIAIYLVIFSISVYVIIGIHKSSCMKNTLMKSTTNYIQGYIKRAVDLGIIKNEDLENVKKALRPNDTIDIKDDFW